ncbi:hypothetical protein ACGFR8_11330 [Streptomyces brevispora]|uniref:hypothetical protein n=1 Tax=Streptomyces brevispora TaxID=887462 RepID=UPI0037111417
MKARGTACTALATTRAPEEGCDAEARIALTEGGAVGPCTLRVPEDPDDSTHRGDGRRLGKSLVELTSRRGNLGANLDRTGSGPGPLPMREGAAWKPELTESRAADTP